ncbi:MAG: alpha-2-macroglobulin family protein [Pseudomonadota bacterium]
MNLFIKPDRKCLFFLLLFFCLIANAWAQFDSAQFNKGSTELRIERITPTGNDAPSERQIVFAFNMPVVPVGRMERTQEEIPISITPLLTGQWRWLNTSTLALQLDENEKMKKSTKYTAVVRPEFISHAGARMKEGITHTFITERPKVENYYFDTWKGPGHPAIYVQFNQEVNVKSALSHILFSSNKGNTVQASGEKVERRYSDYGTTLQVEPQSELPLDTPFDLMVQTGIESEEGPELGVEYRTIVDFYTFPEFEFLGVSGWDNNNNEVTILQGKAQDALLNPLKDISLLFSTPVPREAEWPKLKIIPDLSGGRIDYTPWLFEWDYNNNSLSQVHHGKGHQYGLAFPCALKAHQLYKIKIDKTFKDAFGRSLKDPLDVTFNTDHRPTNIKVINEISVLEKKEETHLPLVVTNIHKLNVDYRIIDDPSEFLYFKDIDECRGNFDADEKIVFPVVPVEDLSYYYPLKTREILQKKSGVVAGVLSAEPTVKSDCTIKFFSQVTNFAVHAKIGYHNTTVWVTGFDNGKPVADALVELFLYQAKEPVTTGKTDQQGIAQLKGVMEIDPWLEKLKGYTSDGFGVVRVTKGDDSALLPLVYEFAESRWYSDPSGDGFYPDNQKKYSYMKAWGATAQGVYRPGDTIDYKIFVRDQSNKKFILPELSGYELEVKDPTEKTVYKANNIILSEFGASSGSFIVPKNAISGWYTFSLKASFAQDLIWSPMRVLVTDFTPAPFKVKTDLSGDKFMIGDTLKIDTSARLHSGGPYGNAAARVTVMLHPSCFTAKSEELKEFNFFEWRPEQNPEQVFQDERELDEKGNLSTDVPIKESEILYGKIVIESSVRDDRGKFIAATDTATYVGRDRFVGLCQKDWILKEDENAEVMVAVVNDNGKPVAGTPIEVKVEYDKLTASRVKGAGNAYLVQYEHTRETVKEFALTSQEKPLTCTFTPQEPGEYHIKASIKDTAGRPHSTCLSRYVIGKGEMLWEMPEDNSLTIVPAQEEYKIGQHARFMVKNPYPGAQALITIERIGVMKKWTETFDTNTPVIEFDIEPDFVPGFYLSVVVHSPRVEKPQSEESVDLGKPTFKIGYLRVPVTDPYKQLNIIPHTNKDVYKPREAVTLDLTVEDITKTHPDTEVAVVVLDEAVLDLIQGGTTYYDPYDGFYKLENLDMKNYNILTNLVGRRKFEKKGANVGGDGGKFDLKMRNLFKFITYWNPSIHPDKNGRASVTFELPDNLTGWRVLAFAVTKDDLMGLGQTRFVTNKQTEIQPALPNQVTEGDLFEAAFTIMNRTENIRTLDVTLKAEGEGVKADVVRLQVEAKPYARNKVSIPVKVTTSGTIALTAKAGDGIDKDILVVKVPIHKRYAIEAAATYGTTTSGEVTEQFAFPENMRTDVGKVSIVVAPSVISELEGAFRYMKDYPYFCWEQRLSKGIMAMHYINLKPYIAESFVWNEAKDVVLDMIRDAALFQAPNGGMCYYIPQDTYVCPYLSAYTAIAFNWLKESGYTVDAKVESALHGYLETLLKRDLFPTFFSKGMSSTVRAVALAALAQNGKITKNDLNRYLPHVEYMDLFGKAHYLLAASKIDQADDIQAKIHDMIMSHANETGGKVVFTDPVYGQYIDREAFGRILTSDTRTNASVLSAMLSLKCPGKWNKSSDTAFKTVRYITQSRKNKDHWENTQENAFCMHALTSFSKSYETEKPDFAVTAIMDKHDFGRSKFDDFRNPPQKLERPIAPGDLGKTIPLTLSKDGPGRLYYSARLFYAPAELKTESINSGIEIHREYSVEKNGNWILLNTDHMKIAQGELIRADIFVSLPAARNFVVVSDPVPGGLEPVNRDLATSSAIDADKDAGSYSGFSWWHKYGDWNEYGYSRWSFYHKELLHHSVRFYSEYLPQGNYHLSYTAQAISPGTFCVLPAHAEEMYDPDNLGQGVPSVLEVVCDEPTQKQ